MKDSNIPSSLTSLLSFDEPERKRKKRRTPDSQRAKVYRAENPMMTHRIHWDSIDDAQAWLDEKLGSAYLRRKYGRMVQVSKETVERDGKRITTIVEERRVPRITVLPGIGKRNAHGDPWRRAIQLPRWAREPQILLHELAHVLTPSSAIPHGWEFCETYLDLVRHIMGKQHADELKRNFRQQRVRFTKPRAKRVLTEAQKQVLRDRMAVARAARAAKTKPE